MKILISAAETSSDAHGAKLLEAIRALAPDVDAFGVGGPKLQAAGLRAVVDARELLSMGFSEILGKLPRIFRALRELEESAHREKPDLAVVIDYPDFHFRLAARLRKQGIPVVYFIPPKVWAWRTGRVKKMKELFSKILCILPFEEKFYAEAGLGVTFVGNPLVDELPLRMTRSEARAKLGLSETETTVVLMPGSRPSELKEHTELFLVSARDAARKIGRKVTVLMPLPATSSLAAIEAGVAKWKSDADIALKLSQGDSATCLVAADAGLIKSGTSTLEAGVLQLPHAVVYRPSKSSQFIFKSLIRYAGPVGLVNLVAEPKGYLARKPFFVREIVNEEVSEKVLAEELVSLLEDRQKIARLKEGFAKLRQKIGTDESPSKRAAREIVQLCRH